jgi:hypothetical protein
MSENTRITAAIYIQYIYRKYKIKNIDILQLDYINTLHKIFNDQAEFICKEIKIFITNFFKLDTKSRKDMKGSPVDTYFENMIQTIISKYIDYLGIKYEMYNDVFVPDIVKILEKIVLCIDGKTINSNNKDTDINDNKVHLGINQSNLGDYNIKNHVSSTNPNKNGYFKGNIKQFYNSKPTLTFVIKLVYNYNKINEKLSCEKIGLYCIPHRKTIYKYIDNIKRGGDKSPKKEQRLEINDDRLVKIINLTNP